MKAQTGQKNLTTKGIFISIAAGVIMSFFYRFVAASMDLSNFALPEVGKLTPYTAVFVFALGVFLSNFIFNTVAMKHPVEGKSVSMKDYFKGTMTIAYGRHTRWCCLVCRTVFQYDSLGKSWCGHFLWTWTRGNFSFGLMGNFDLERI